MRAEAVVGKLREIAREEVPEGADLWPAIAARVERERPGRLQRRRTSRRRLLAAGMAAVLLALVLATGGPTALAKVGDMLQRFGMVLLSPEAVSRQGQPTPTAAPRLAAPQFAGEARPVSPSLDLAEVQQQVSFQIRVPSWLPDNVVFRGAMAAGQSAAVVSYRHIDDPSRGMFLQMQKGPKAGGHAVPASVAQEVQVHGRPATYAKGAWTPDQRWDGSIDAGMLSWEDDGFTYVLSYSGLGLSREDLVRIAESLR